MKKAQTGSKLSKPSFEEWYKTVPKEKNYMGDYDLRAAYDNLPYEEMVKFATTNEGHLPDTYKLPNHPTFSNESIYYQGIQPGLGGYWNEDAYTPNPLIGPPIMKNGGELSANKAKTMLKEDQANGKKLTKKQKSYFGWIAGGNKADNGVNMTGYLDWAPTADNPYNIIPGQNGMTPITMDGVSQPIYANGQYLPAQSGSYLFPGNQVFETPAQAQNGAAVPIEQGQQFNPWLYEDPNRQYFRAPQQVPEQLPMSQPSYMNQPQGQTFQNLPSQASPQQSSPNYGGWIQQGAQAIGGVLDTIGDLKKGFITGGASILNSLIPDNQPRRNYQPQVAYNRDAYGQDQYNNMFEAGGQIARSGAVVTNYGYNDPIPGITAAQEAALNQFVPYQQQSTYNPPPTPSYTSTGDDRDYFTKAYRNSAGRAQSGTNYSGQMWGDYSKIAPPLPGQNDPYGESYIQDPNGGFRMNTNLAPTRFAYNTGQPYQMQFGGKIDKDGYQEVELTKSEIEKLRAQGYDIQF